MSVFGRNQEGYPDTTAAEAIAKASKKKYLPLVYICSKYSGDVVTNTEAAKRYSRATKGKGKRRNLIRKSEVFYFYSQLYSQHVIIILVGNKSWVKEHINGY